MKKCIKMISEFLISFWYTFSCPSSPINARWQELIQKYIIESRHLQTDLGRFIASSTKPCSSTELKYVKTSNKSPLEILVNELLLYELRFTINHSQLLFNGRTHFNKTIIEKTSNDPKIIATARFFWLAYWKTTLNQTEIREIS